MFRKKVGLVFVSYFNEIDIKDNIGILFQNNSAISHELEIIIIETGGDISEVISTLSPEISCRVTLLSGPEKILGHPSPGSRQHADSLDLAYAYCVREDFSHICFCDPDLIVTTPNWLDCYLTEMEEESVAIFGVPYFPIHYGKYRYFPTVMFSIIDLGYFRSLNVKFSDQLQTGMGSLTKAAKSVHWAWIREKLPTFLRLLTFSRFKVGKSRDTGYQFYELCILMGISYKSLQPIILETQFPFAFSRFKHAIIKLLDKIVPEGYAILPKSKGSYRILRDSRSLQYDPQFEHYGFGQDLAVFHRRSSLNNSTKSLMEYFDRITEIR